MNRKICVLKINLKNGVRVSVYISIYQCIRDREYRNTITEFAVLVYDGNSEKSYIDWKKLKNR